MPELPELEIVREVLTRRLAGRRIEAVTLAAKGATVIVRDPEPPWARSATLLVPVSSACLACVGAMLVVSPWQDRSAVLRGLKASR